MLKRLKFVGVSWNEDVNIQLSLDQSQAFGVPPGNHLVAMTESYPKLSHCDNLLFRVVKILQNNFKQNFLQVIVIKNELQWSVLMAAWALLVDVGLSSRGSRYPPGSWGHDFNKFSKSKV